MFETIHSGRSALNADKATRRGTDPLARTILRDLLVTTTAFLLAMAAVVLTVDGLLPH
jgi:hypothetical protein